jgi:hypothetical protein
MRAVHLLTRNGIALAVAVVLEQLGLEEMQVLLDEAVTELRLLYQEE